MEKLTNEEYDLLVDVLYECEKDLVALEKTIAALKSRWDWMLSTFNPNMKNSYGD